MKRTRAPLAASAATAAIFLTGCQGGGLSTASWWPWKSSNNELASTAPAWQQPQLPSASTPAQTLTGGGSMSPDASASTSVYPQTQPMDPSATAMAPQQGPYPYTDTNAYSTTPPGVSYPATGDPAAAPADAYSPAPIHVADNRGLGDSQYANPAPQPAYGGADPTAQPAATPAYNPNPPAYAPPVPAPAYPASYNEPNPWPATPQNTPPSAAYPAPAEAYPPMSAAPASPYVQPAAGASSMAAAPAPGAPAMGQPWRPGSTTDYVPRAGSNLAAQPATPAGWNQPSQPAAPWPAGGMSTTGGSTYR